MDYREHLLRPLARHFVDLLVQEVFLHPGDAKLIYQLIFDEEIKVAWRAAWACQKISPRISQRARRKTLWTVYAR